MSRGAWRYRAFARNTELIKRFCDHYNFSYLELNNGYQIRIEGVLDVYPVRQRWHWLETGERGDWADEESLRRLMLEKLPVIPEPSFKPVKATPKRKWWKFWRR